MERGTLQEDLMPIPLGPFAFYLNCFNELSSCRQIGFSLGPIPITAIWSYADRYELSEDFCNLMRRMDVLYLDSMDKKSKKEDKDKEGI